MPRSDSSTHKPEQRHSELSVLNAIAQALNREVDLDQPAEWLFETYAEAVRAGYLWHEFGDSHLPLRHDPG